MQLTFPRKNLALNNLIDFRNASTIYEFTDYLSKPEEERDSWKKENLQFNLNTLEMLFEGLNEEINQVIHTSNDKTINMFFETLKEEINSLRLQQVDRGYFIQICREWNENKYSAFIEEVSKKEEQYFSLPERTKYAHLEKYSYSYYGFLTNRMESSENENHNFYCVEIKPELIDLSYVNRYLEILERVTEKFNESVSKEITLYDDNKLAGANVENPQSFYDKSVETIKSNKIVAIVLFLFVLYAGVSEVIKLTKENKEVIDSINGDDKTSHYEKPTSDLITIKMDQISAVDYGPEPENKNLTFVLKVIPKSKDKFVPLKGKGIFVLIDPLNKETEFEFDLNTDGDGVKPSVISFLYLDGFIPKDLFETIMKSGKYKGRCIFFYDTDIYPSNSKYTSDIFLLKKEVIRDL